jgi:ABC-type transport system substrate-binding protein
VGWTDVTPSTVGYNTDIDPFPFDVAKAKQLLADAGYPGGNGFGKLILNTQQGQAVTNIPDAAQVIADSWRKNLGLDVEVRVGDATALKNATTTTDSLWGQLLLRDNNTRIDALDFTWRRYAGTNFDRATDDPDVIALANNATSIFDPAERERALIALYKRLADEQYDISIGTFSIPWGVGPRVQAWTPYPLAFYPSALDTITLR